MWQFLVNWSKSILLRWTYSISMGQMFLNNVLWPGTVMKFGVEAKCSISGEPLTVKHGGQNVLPWSCFLASASSKWIACSNWFNYEQGLLEYKGHLLSFWTGSGLFISIIPFHTPENPPRKRSKGRSSVLVEKKKKKEFRFKSHWNAGG